MKYIEHGKGGGPECMALAEGPIPQPAPGQILIEVVCAGVNRPDVLQRSGKYPPPPDASPILGLEVAGRVTAVGEGVTLQAFHAPPPPGAAVPPGGPTLAVLLHGWEGSAASLYILSLAQRLFGHGYDVVRLNLRDHGDTHHLNRDLFHSCRLSEMVGAVRRLQADFPAHRLVLAGWR